MRINDVLFRLIGARDTNCPYEADVLAYSENGISRHARARLERHFSRCHDCQEVLAFLVREPEQQPAPLTENAVSQQTARILAYIDRDEISHSKPAPKRRPVGRFSIPYQKLASVMSVMVLGGFLAVRLFTPAGPSPAELAKKAIISGIEHQRNTSARVSELDYSKSSSTTRGGTRGDETETPGDDQSNAALRLRQVINLLSSAQREDAPAEDRLMLARAYVALGTMEEARQALDILTQLSSRGVDSRELFNDMGVAQFRLKSYTDAIASFTMALKKSPGYEEALFNLALAEEEAHSIDDAKRDWQQFLNQSTDENWKQEARTRLAHLSVAR